MLSGHRSAPRRRRNSRAARIAVPLAIPMALGLTLGIILAVSAAVTPRRSRNRPWALRLSRGQRQRRGARGERHRRGRCRQRDAPASAASAPGGRGERERPGGECERPGVSPGRTGSLPVGFRLSGGIRAGRGATTVAGIPPINPAGRPGLAGSNAVDAAGNAFSFAQTQPRRWLA